MRLGRSVFAKVIGLVALTMLVVGGASHAFADPVATVPAPSGPTGGTLISVSRTDTGSAIQTPLDQSTQAFKDELAKKQARLTELETQLDSLDRELEIASENFNAAEDRLGQLKKKLAQTQSDLGNAQNAYNIQVAALKARVIAIYRGDELDALGVLLDSKSASDFLNRVSFLGMIGEKDVTLADQLANQRDSIQQSYLDMNDAKLEAEQLDFNMRARRIEIQLRIQEREQMLASAQSDLLVLLGQQQATRQQDQAVLMQQILSGAGNVGIKVVPGTPVETALAYHGIPYLWGGATPAGFDCSGLVMYVFAQHGVSLPHYSGAQFLLGTPVQPVSLQPNDVVFFGSPIHHVGIYLGNDYFIEAPHTGAFVRVSRLSDRSDYAGARRYPWVPRTAPILGVTTPASYPSVPLTR